MYLVGIDIGGTFTDVFGLDTESGVVTTRKTPTTPENFVKGVVRGIKALGVSFDRIDRIVHGTTICTNALIEHEQARTGFITTKGFGDELDIQRMVRRWGKSSWSSIYDLHQRKPAPFVPKRLRMELDERVVYPGTVIKALDTSEAREAVGMLRDRGVEAVAVCFLWSFLHPEHEVVVRDIVREELPQVHVSISSEVSPTFREYERMVTTAVNASLMPVMSDYVSRIESELGKEGFRGTLLLIQSHGGVAYPAMMKELPIYTLRGGPVGGAVAASHLGRQLNRRRILSCDIGGTSCDTSVILDHELTVLEETEVDYYPIRVPTADIRCIGAGGGSVARLDVADALAVGPESAGASPGPACYGRGGKAPTLSDANLVLGRLPPGGLGEIVLDLDSAEASMSDIAQRLGWNARQTADAIVRVAIANMAASVRLQTIDRGYDPREFSLVAFGGAGPLHATLLADATAIPEVILPRGPGVFSTFGMVVSELAYYAQTAFLKPMEDVAREELERLNREYERLEAAGRAVLRRSRVPNEKMRFVRIAGMRYTMQEWELRVPVPNEKIDEAGLNRIAERFHEIHRARHGFAKAGKPVEFVTLFVETFGGVEDYRPSDLATGETDAADALTSRREVFLDRRTGMVEVPVYTRERLKAGHRIEGPAIVEEATATAYVSTGWAGEVERSGNIILNRWGSV